MAKFTQKNHISSFFPGKNWPQSRSLDDVDFMNFRPKISALNYQEKIYNNCQNILNYEGNATKSRK
jgi:hypothetical protein